MLRGLARLGFDAPTPIQQLAIPAVAAGADLAVEAPTGSSKTVAYALPLLQRILTSERGAVRVWIVVPTRELALQVAAVCKRLVTHDPRPSKVVALFGGEPVEGPIVALRSGADPAARGLDIPRVRVVVPFDLPRSPQTCTHCVGRTARAGAGGMAVTFVDHASEAHMRLIEKRRGARLGRETVEGFALSEAGQGAAADEGQAQERERQAAGEGGGEAGGGSGQRPRPAAGALIWPGPARPRATARDELVVAGGRNDTFFGEPRGGPTERPRRSVVTAACRR